MDKIPALEKRAKVIRVIRDFFVNQGFLEVETPLLLPANAPEEYIDPVFANNMQLQTSPELCMKRLLCRGYDKIFQICHCFRADERGSRHLSEFTMLEWYRANADYNHLMQDCIGLLRNIATDCTDNLHFTRYGISFDPFTAWKKLSVQEAFHAFAAVDSLKAAENGTFDEILVTKVEPGIAEIPVPVILYDYPSSMAALSRLKNDDNRFAERFELYIGGLELANGFSELNDPNEQLIRFEEANSSRIKKNRIALTMPLQFLDDLSKMPASAGIAMGIDRLVMLATGLDLIDQVVAFTPEML